MREQFLEKLISGWQFLFEYLSGKSHSLWLDKASSVLMVLGFVLILSAMLRFVYSRKNLGFRLVWSAGAAAFYFTALVFLTQAGFANSHSSTLEMILRFAAGFLLVLSGAFLWRLMPVLRAIPSQTEMKESESKLQKEIFEHIQTQEHLRFEGNQLQELIQKKETALDKVNFLLQQQRLEKKESEEKYQNEIRDLKKREDRLLCQQKELESAVQKKTNDLAQAGNLLQQQRQEKKENEEKYQNEIKNLKKQEERLRDEYKKLEAVIQTKISELESLSAQLQKQIQERRENEEALRKKESFSRALMESVSGIVVILDDNSVIQYESPSLGRVLGYGQGAVTGRCVIDFIHQEDLPRVKKALSVNPDTLNELKTVRFRALHADGTWRHLEAGGKKLPQELGASGLIVNVSDASDKIRMETEIRWMPDIIRFISEKDDFISAMEAALQKICELGGWEYGEAWTPREDGKILECSPVWVGDEEFKEFRELSQEIKILPNMGIPGIVWASGRMRWLSDFPGLTRAGFTRGVIAKQCGIQSSFAVPVVFHDRTLAVLMFFHRQKRPVNAKLMNLMSSIAAHLGAVLVRRIALEDLRKGQGEIEKKIEERTREITQNNAALQKEIAEGKLLEESLRRSEKNYRALFDSVDGIVWEYDLASSRFTFVNQQAIKILGYPLNQWMNEPAFWHDHVHGEDRERVVNFRRDIANGSGAGQYEYRMVTAEGKTLWFRDFVSPVLEKGEIVKLRGLMVDVTERKIAEAAWREERNFVAAILDTASALVMIMDEDGHVARMNHACEVLSGYAQEEIRDRKFWDVFIVDEEKERVKNTFRRLLAGQFPATFESYWVAKDGSRRVIAWSNTVLTNKEKNTSHVIATGIDITKRKEIERKLQETVTDLERTNLDLDKYSGELKDANRRLKKLDELKSHFISAASHELKTPLTSLKGYVEMVFNGEAGEINAEQKEYLRYVKESTDRLHRLVNELLNISKIESGQVKMRREATDLQALIKEEVTLFKPRAQEKSITLSMDVDFALKQIYCDSDRIREVMDNLLSNAIKYTQTKGSIKIFARNHDQGVAVGVKDNGIGIKEEDQQRIFDPFQHVEKTGVEDEEESTGLGLTLVKEIVEAHGGSIQVESCFGKGSVFTVVLPLDMKNSTAHVLTEQMS